MDPQLERRLSLSALIKEYGYEWLGARIKMVRVQQQLSIRDVAELAQVSKNTVLRIEQGQATHASTLVAVCKSLKARPKRLLEIDSKTALISIHRDQDYTWYDMLNFISFSHSTRLAGPGAGTFEKGGAIIPFAHLKSQDEAKKFTAHVIVLTNETPMRSHRGEEFVFVLEGEVDLVLGGTTYRLKSGESATFKAGELHQYVPISDRPPKILSIVIAPFRSVTLSKRGRPYRVG